MNVKAVEQYEYIEEWLLNNDRLSQFMNKEISVVDNQIKERNHQNWCDVDFNTGWHLRNVNGEFSKIGITDDPAAVEFNENNIDAATIRMVQGNFLEMPLFQKFDLVTNFFFRYTRHNKLSDSMRYLYKMAEMVERGGSMIFSFHNPGEIFDYIPCLSTNDPNSVQFDGYAWSYTMPHQPQLRYRCVSPHKQLIVANLKKRFAGVKVVQYERKIEDLDQNTVSNIEHPGAEILIFEDKIL